MPLRGALIGGLSFWILNQKPSLRTLNENNEQNQRCHHDQEQEYKGNIAGGFLRASQGLEHCRWKLCHNTCKNDQRDTVANAARCNLLTKPHKEHGSAGQ